MAGFEFISPNDLMRKMMAVNGLEGEFDSLSNEQKGNCLLTYMAHSVYCTLKEMDGDEGGEGKSLLDELKMHLLAGKVLVKMYDVSITVQDVDREMKEAATQENIVYRVLCYWVDNNDFRTDDIIPVLTGKTMLEYVVDMVLKK